MAIDWSATGSMIGGIGSVIAVGVAVGLSEVQHRRTIRLIDDQDRRSREKEGRETIVLATWLVYVLIDLRWRAAHAIEPYGTIAFPEEMERFPADDAEGLSALILGFPLNYELVAPRALDVLPRLPPQLADAVMTPLRMARSYDLLNSDIATLLKSGQIKVPNLRTLIAAQVTRLTEVRDNADEAYRAIAPHFGFPPLEVQLMPKAPAQGPAAG